MKRIYTIATALLIVAGSFTSCTKDLDEVGLNATSIDAAKKDVQGANNNPRIDADLNLNFSPTEQMVGQMVSVTASFGINAPSDGKVHLEQATGVDSDGNTVWTLLQAYNVTAGAVYTYNFTSNVVGTFEFRAHYIAQGNNGFKNAFQTGSVTYVDNCVQDMTAEVVENTHLGDNVYRLKVAFTLNTCKDYSDVHIQGGMTAKVSNIEVSAGGEIRNHTKNDNYIVQWDEASLAKGSRTYYVTFDKEIKDAGMVTGDWTATTLDGAVVATTEGAYFSPSN